MNPELEKLQESAINQYGEKFIDNFQVKSLTEKAFTLGREEERKELREKVEKTTAYYGTDFIDREFVINLLKD